MTKTITIARIIPLLVNTAWPLTIAWNQCRFRSTMSGIEKAPMKKTKVAKTAPTAIIPTAK